MKFALMTAILLLSHLAIALPDFTQETCVSSTSGREFQCPAYVNECAVPALAKIQAQAQAQSLTVDVNTFTVSEVDDRFYNPYKYVWFHATAAAADGSATELGALTQKSYLPLKPCF